MQSSPTPPDLIRTEHMNGSFTKYHLGGGRVLHRFTEPDTGEPHNHPWGFTSHVLSGGYVEEVYGLLPDGTVSMQEVERLPGTSHRVEAATVHRLVRLLGPECWTLIEAGPWEQKSGFYRFDDAGIWFRHWDEPAFTLQVARVQY
ncbi:hypothetical protein [Hymenobacter sp. BT491]|uniref:hypothetical protein n=1 Tax=Hymenobacter sp. BT491 TaxID=2766779 RepID=UPI001653E340|nr:hypothetical protein [Hymenobacter sp. BT491]MBC6988950.1 hypothetical protein [Hymenobacter sp. BT491]